MKDEENKKFIEWAIGKIEEPGYLKMLVLKNIYKQIRFYNSENFKKLLEKKLWDGGSDHAAPGKYSKRQVHKRLAFEMLDLVGWHLIGLWCEKKRREK